jgi:hypothetical protein
LIGAGVGEEVSDGLRGGVGEGGVDGDLVEIVVVDGGDAERVQELLDEPVRGVRNGATCSGHRFM